MIRRKQLINRIFAITLSVGITLASVMPIYATEITTANEAATEAETESANNLENNAEVTEENAENTSEVTTESSVGETTESASEESESEETSEVTPEAAPETSPETTPEVTPEATPEVSPEVTATPTEAVAPTGTEDTNAVDGKMEINGDSSSWTGVTSQPGSGVDNWKVVMSEDSQSIGFSYTGNSSSQWDYSYASPNNYFTIKFADGSEWNYCVVNDNGVAKIKGSWYEDVNGEAIIVNNANQNNGASYFIEFAIPLGNLKSGAGIVSVTYGGTTVEYDNIQKFSGTVADTGSEETPVYSGITNDGDYSDWDAVTKVSVSCPTHEHSDCIMEIATVWDGDKFNLYIKEGSGTSATLAGTHSNGKFAIKSDLGYELDFQLNRDGTISGVDGVTVSYIGDQWEITIPENLLPHYNSTLSVELYNGATLVDGISNLNGNTNENTFSGITFDGDYSDWKDYPQSTIQYATSGSQSPTNDAKGSVYMDDNNVYAHVKTEMQAHLDEAGGEYTSAVSIVFNSSNPQTDSWNSNTVAIHARYVAVDENGNINWNPQLSNLEAGKTYTFYIADLSSWGSSTNINNLNPNDTLYGQMTMTIGVNGCDEMEMYLDKNLIANRYNLDVHELKSVSAQFGRIGQQWITATGASSGPWLGILISILAVLITLAYSKRCKTIAG